ncbi:MAG: 6-pyruvoyl-tetrahydropterin synthase-related protein [Anaerolineae bacterium]|nr:6-pyruvoyl-tetrahydropterin synthase-related protein [Anaerolineae bacterium]MDW8173504.1 6-pyruvoyl-tetrahydropterin synthase-related protein [Anaerolineae bacterium]
MNPNPNPRRQPFWDRGLWLVIVLALLSSLIPLSRAEGLPNGSDVLYHVYRAAEMSRAWEQGLLFPRWADGLYFGYGAPLWHFYAPLTYYLSASLMALGLGPLTSLRLLIVVTQVSMAAGMYVFARQQMGKLGGLLAALAYLWTPYMLYTEPYARGTYPEMLAFALWPFAFWRLGQLLDGAVEPRWGVLSLALCVFLLILSHNLMSATAFALLLAWWLWHTVGLLWQQEVRTPLQQRPRSLAAWGHALAYGHLQPVVLALLSLSLGVGLAAYFWLPILAEGHTVNLQNLTAYSLLDYRAFFVPLSELLGLRPIPDLGALNGLANVYQVGPYAWIAALIGGVMGLRLARDLRGGGGRVLFFALLSLALLALMAPFARPVWDALGFLQTLQFPFRLLGPLAFSLAVLVGYNALWIERLPTQWRAWPVALGIAAPLLLAAPSLVVPEWTNQRVDTSLAAYHREEETGRQRATTFTNEYLPRAVAILPTGSARLLGAAADGRPVDRLHHEALPPNAQATLLSSGPQASAWRVQSDETLRLEVLIFAWEGWRASVDGQDATIIPSVPHGFITFEVPPGSYEVRVWLGPTIARVLGDSLSLIAIVLLAASIGLLRHLPARASRPADSSLPWDGIAAGLATALPLLVLLLLIPGTAWLNTPYGETPAQWRQVFTFSAPAAAPRPQDEIRLLGYDLGKRAYRPGETLRLTLYWLPLLPADQYSADYSSFVHVARLSEPPIAQADKLHVAGRKVTEWWTPTGYMVDRYEIRLPDDARGEFELRVGLYTCAFRPEGECGNGDRPLVSTEGMLLGNSAPLGTITIQD